MDPPAWSAPFSSFVGTSTAPLALQPPGPLYSSPRGPPVSHFSPCSTRNKVPRQLSLKTQLCIMDKGQLGICVCSVASISGLDRSVLSPEPRGKGGGDSRGARSP